MEKVAMCGYRCDLCSGFASNIKNKDEREMLSNVWNKYYDLNIPTEKKYIVTVVDVLKKRQNV